MATMQRVRLGVIGAGGIAHSVHLPALNDIDRCEIVWICDLSADKARIEAERWHVPVHGTSYFELLREHRPDAVFVLVQPDLIFRIVLDCLHAGCHVFTEKPLGITLFQAETIAQTARALNLQCQVGFNRRFIPLVRAIVERMKDLGPIHQIDGWFYKNGDASFYQGCSSAFTCDAIHTVDLVRHIAGANAEKTVQLAGRYGNSGVDNAWNALIAFQNGITGTVHSNYATGGRVHGFALHSSSASAYINIGFGAEACSAKILHHVAGTFSIASNGAGEQHIEALDGRAVAGSDQYYRYYGYFQEDQMFVDALLKGRKVVCDAEDALATMRLLELLKAGEFSCRR